MALPVAPAHAEIGNDPHRGSQRPHGVGGLRDVEEAPGEPVRPEKDHCAPETAGQCRIHQRGLQDPSRVPVITGGDAGGDHLRDSQRKAVGRKQQNDRVDIKSSGIIAVSLVPDDPGQRKPVHQPDDAGDDAGRGVDAALDQKTVVTILHVLQPL